MWIIDRIRAAIEYPLVHLAAGTVTLATMLTALLVMVVARLLARLAAREVNRLLLARDLPEGARFAFVKIVRYLVLLIGLLIAVTSVGFRLDALLAASTVLLVGIGFGLQNIAQNFVCGIILLLERPVSRGDFVQLGDTFGSVIDIGMRATRVVTRDEVTIIVPNSELITAKVVNHSVPTTNLRIAVRVGVAYGTDARLVQETLLRVAREEPSLLQSYDAEVRFEDFGESSLDFALLVWIADPQQDRRTSSQLRFAIDVAFRAANIEIPFPQRDVHVRSGLEPLRRAAGT